MSTKITKKEEEILALVKKVNDKDALAGLGVTPDEPAFHNKEFRFVKRLMNARKIAFQPCTPERGAGWILQS